ncbi:DUF3987 domain-containing protein [Chitinilyticum litopenaei]|uniref:DUF3987 domain-containing protein n=1 Tax=Chitinilyticum litopenaei TaxID=1121276 RepID=UPI0003F6304E|nr:DUF3987 domain-containing protein [Chitinilyticum litopenaei]
MIDQQKTPLAGGAVEHIGQTFHGDDYSRLLALAESSLLMFDDHEDARADFLRKAGRNADNTIVSQISRQVFGPPAPLPIHGKEPHLITDAAAQPPEPFEEEAPATPWPDDCLPGIMQDAADAIAEHVKAPHALAGMAVLAAVAHIAQRLVDAPRPSGGQMPCSLFVLTLLESGGRKSECFNLATAPITKSEIEKRNAHRAECQRLEQSAAAAKPKDRAAIMAQCPPDPRTLYRESTVEKIIRDFVRGSQPAMSWATDEGGVALGGHSLRSETCRASLGNLTRLFDGSGCERDRIGDGQSGFRFGIRFGLFLSCQPIVAREAMADPLLSGQGFFPRFLLAAPESLTGTRFIEPGDLERKATDDERLAAYWQTLAAMDAHAIHTDEHGGLTLPAVAMTSEAVEVWRLWFNRIEASIEQFGDYAHIAPFGGRAGELARRIAAVFACWRQFEGGLALPVVDADDMRRAIALCNYSLAEWARTNGSARLSQTERDAQSLLRWMQHKCLSSFTRSVIAQGCTSELRGSRNKQRRTAAIDELLRRRWLAERDGALFLFSEAATATSATSATKPASNGPESSKSSGNSSSTLEALNFADADPAPPPADDQEGADYEIY